MHSLLSSGVCSFTPDFILDGLSLTTYDPAMATLTQHLNSLAPEILAHIFVLGLWRSQLGEGWCAAVSEVCRDWRSVALDTPALWATIYLQQPKDFRALPILLQRAKNADTEITITSCAKKDAKLWDATLKAIVQHSAYISVLKFNLLHLEKVAKSVLNCIGSLSTSRLNKLELVLYTNHSSTTVLPKELLRKEAPRLHSFTTTILTSDWSSPIFRNLRHVTLQLPGTRLGYGLLRRVATPPPDTSVPEIQRILIDLPALEALHVSGGRIAPGYAPAFTSMAQRPALQDVEIVSDIASGDVFEQLLDMLPSVSIKRLVMARLPAPCGAALLSHLPALDNCAISLGTDMVRSGCMPRPESAAEGSCYDGTWRILARARRSGMSRAFELGWEIFMSESSQLPAACGACLATVTRLHLRAGQWLQTSACLAQVAMPAVTELVLSYAFVMCVPASSPYYMKDLNRSGPWISGHDESRLHALERSTGSLHLPSLRTVILGIELPAEHFRPSWLALDVLRGILDAVGFESPRLPLLRLVNVEPDCGLDALRKIVDEHETKRLSYCELLTYEW